MHIFIIIIEFLLLLLLLLLNLLVILDLIYRVPLPPFFLPLPSLISLRFPKSEKKEFLEISLKINSEKHRNTIDRLEFTVSLAVMLIFLKNYKRYLGLFWLKTLPGFCSIWWKIFKISLKLKSVEWEWETDKLTLDFTNIDELSLNVWKSRK